MRKLFLFSVMLLAVPAAQASMNAASGGSEKHSQLNISLPFEQQRQKILADLADGDVYSEITQADRLQVRDALNRIGDSLQRAGSVDQLSADDRAKVFNDQELVNSILTRAGEDSRLVCTREKKVGSHRTTTQCHTVAERRRMHQQSRDELDKNFRQPILEQR